MNDKPKPTEAHIKALRQMEKMERGESVVINSQDAEECVSSGWAEAVRGGGYSRTDAGRAILSETDEGAGGGS